MEDLHVYHERNLTELMYVLKPNQNYTMLNRLMLADMLPAYCSHKVSSDTNWTAKEISDREEEERFIETILPTYE